MKLKTKNLRSKNPVPASVALQKKLAGNLYKEFSGHEPEVVAKIDNFEIPDVVLLIGDINAIEYDTIRDGQFEKYRHRFSAKSRPLLASSYDGKQLFILGGEYDFTNRGIVDRKVKE